MLDALRGVWRGAGHGQFPTMPSFDYDEEVRFTDVGAPFLHYLQRGWQVGDGELLHAETGIWRPYPDGRVAITIALPRVAEISEGHYADGTIELRSTSVRRADGGAALTEVRRSYALDGDRLDYEIDMATEGVPRAQRHLVGHLMREGIAGQA